jgi:hypothetical protein
VFIPDNEECWLPACVDSVDGMVCKVTVQGKGSVSVDLGSSEIRDVLGKNDQGEYIDSLPLQNEVEG